MNNETINHIIENYKPHQGFYDLSVKPKTLTKVEYAKVLNAQNILAEAGTNKEYLERYDPIQWGDWKEISAMYQAIIFQHWGVIE